VEGDAGGQAVIDVDVYLHLLLTQSITAAFAAEGFDEVIEAEPWCAPDIDVDTLEKMPAVTWNILADGEVPNGPGLWNYILNLNCFGYGMDQAKALARGMHAIAEGWDENTAGTVIEVDGDDVWLSSVDTNLDIPTRLPAAIIEGRLTVQYSGSYAIGVRSNA
jgi:hypothetical protein